MAGIFGTLVQGALGGFATIPDAPQAPFVDPSQAQMDSIRGNQRALPELMELGEDVNAYNLQQRAKALGSVPNFGAISQAGGDALLSMTRGELPQDVANQVQRRANVRAYQGGYGGSGMSDNLTARDLGLTSLDLQQRGIGMAPGWLTSMFNLSAGPQFNVESGFLTPGQGIAAQQWNETNRYQRDWLQNQLDSIPDPEQAAIAESVGQLTDVVATAALAWAGGGLGAMTGIAGGAAMGGQIGGALGGGGGLGGAASQFGGALGGLIPASVAAPTAVTPNWGQSYPGPYGGYLPPVQQQVNPFGGGSVYNPSADIWGLGGYSMGAPTGYGGF